MGKGGPRYTPEDAKGRIPTVIKRMVLTGIELEMLLDTHPIDSREVENLVVALTGHAGHLSRLCHVIWKHEGLKRAAAEKAAPPAE